MVYKPKWFTDGKIFVSFAETVGINKDGNVLFEIEESTGQRTDKVNDLVTRDIDALLTGETTRTSRWIESSEALIGAPTYYDTRYGDALQGFLERPEFSSFEARTLASLIKEGEIEHRGGHGSPSADMRSGSIPYIKVSDIRAGLVNINPSNRVTKAVARQFWRAEDSSLRPFDLISPIRASKNIGEFAVLMPGQEEVVLTKEMLVLRAADKSGVDNFFLLWALSLKVVRDQWKRVVLMQTNREDVGPRYLEIEVPWPTDAAVAADVSRAFREYYVGVDRLRRDFVQDLVESNDHHVFLGTSAATTD